MKKNDAIQKFDNAWYRKKAKKLQDQLSLPKIQEKPFVNTPKTSVRTRKSKPINKFISQTTVCPQQQYLHDQVRTILCGEPPRGPSQKIKKIIQEHSKKQKPEKSQLPSIKSPQKLNIEEPVVKKMSNVRIYKSRSSVTHKLDLNSILNNRNNFVEAYFADLYQKRFPIK